MYPNLLGQKAYYHLTDEMMGDIIGVSRNAYAAKIKSGRFTPQECRTLCRYFGKSFEFLFEEPDEQRVEKVR